MTSGYKQAVGSNYVLEQMRLAREKTWEVIARVSSHIEPGMRETEATAYCKQVIAELGADRIWHPVLIRFGENTLKKFNQRSEGDPVLQEHDVFFIDLGIVWNGHEGDAGATFAVGGDADMIACAQAAQTLFDEVKHHWEAAKVSGSALYEFADRRARELGLRLNADIKGHRVSDFPHAIYKAGDLGDFDRCPDVGLWILEIQIAHPSRPFGAFYEDLLI